ncbi:uncharacterized protein LOC143253388 [Tachypleus tridentatus]|uniref:uncharacterized protein LOC143253388 n=1 Tax=Tachypleus tridentatus TaxID=6853 RepID=UPI003FD27B97
MEKSPRQDGELDYSMEKSPRQDGELDYSTEKSPRQDGKLDHSTEKSLRQDGELDYSTEKSPRQDGELDYSTEKSPRQDGKLDYSTEKSPRQDGKLDYSTEKSPRQDGELDYSTEKSPRQDGELDYSTEKSPRQDGELDYSTEKSPRQDGELGYSTEKSPGQGGKLGCNTEKSPGQGGKLGYSTEKSPGQGGKLGYSTEKSPGQGGKLGYSTEKSPGQGGKLGYSTEKSPGQGGKLGYSTEKSPGQGGKLGYSTEKSPGQGGKLGYSTEKSPGQGGRLGYSTEKSPRQGGRLGYSTEKSPRQGGRLGYSTEKSPRQGGRLGYSMEKSPKQGGRLGYSMEKSPKQGGKLGYSIEESPSCDEKLDYTSEESSHDIDGKLSFSTVKSPNKDERSNYSPRKSPSKYVKLSGNIKSPQKNNYRKQNILSEDQEMSCSEEKLQRDIEEGNDNDVVKLPNKFSYEEKESGENKKIVLGKENIFSSIGKESNEGVSDNHDSVNVEDSVKKERFKISPINDIQLINSSHITRSLSKLRTSTLRRSTRVRTQSNISCELGSTAGEASLKTADALKNMFVATDKLEELASSDAPIEDIKVLKTCTPAHKINKQMNNNLAREPVVHLSLTEFGCHSKGSSQSETEQHSFISGSLDPVMPEKEMVSDSEDSVKNLGSIVRLRSRRLLESGDETSKDSAIVCDEGFKDESSKQPASNNEVSSISSPTHGYELRTPHAKLITSIRKRYIENIDECSNENPSLLPKLSPTKSRSLVFEDTTEDLHCSVLLQLDTSEMPPKVYNVTPSKSFSSCTEFSKRKSLNIVKGSDVENSKEPSVSSNVGEFHSPSVQLRNKSVTDTSLSGRKEKPSYSLSQKLVTDSNVPLTRNSPRKIEYNLRSRRKSSGTPNKRN